MISTKIFFTKSSCVTGEIRHARKQEIYDQFSVYENFCLEIEGEIDFMIGEVDGDISLELHIASYSNDCDKLEEIRNEAEEKLEIKKSEMKQRKNLK